MSRKCLIAKEIKKQKLVLKYAKKRNELRCMLKDPNLSSKEKLQAQFALQKLPIRSCPVRLKNRCLVTGRAKGLISKQYMLSRITFREYALKGFIPGVKKASW